MRVDLRYDEGRACTVVELLEPVEAGGYTIPAGFVSDGASVPRSLWSYCDPLDARYLHVFVLHDWLYSTRTVGRKEADKLMRKLLAEAGMSALKAYSIYAAVRAFGGSHYEED